MALEYVYQAIPRKFIEVHLAHDLLKKLFEENGVDDAHGIVHARKVLYHAWDAVSREDMEDVRRLIILLASLLHDADAEEEKKNKTTEYPNARKILREVANNLETPVIRLISIVSFSKNKDIQSADPTDLIPRWSDRLEAMGEVGIARCYMYSKTIGNPLFLPDTPRVTNKEELDKVADADRFLSYNGTSRSMIDHYYDKLVHLSFIKPENKYLREELERRNNVILQFLFEFGRTGQVDVKYLEGLAKKHK